MYHLKKKLTFIITASFVYFSAALFSCTRAYTSGTTTSEKCTVQISNPEFDAQIGSQGGINALNGPAFEVEISVTILNSANQAVDYKPTKVVQFARTANGGPQSLLTIDNVEIPSSGPFVIEYILRSQHCTWAQAPASCYIQNVGSSSKKNFKDKFTFTTGGNLGTHHFFCTFSNRYSDICC